LIILCNRNAGRSKEEILFFKNLDDVDLEVIEEKCFLERVEQLANTRDRVVVMGGDGTVNKAIQVLAHTNTALGIIPAGRGNDFSRYLGIPQDPLDALSIARKGLKTKVGLGKVAGRYFCNSLGVGFDAYIISLVNRYGKDSYKFTTFKNLFDFPSFKISIEATLTDGSKISLEKEVLMAVFGNGITEGGGIRISHKKDISEKFLSLTLVEDLPTISRLINFPLFLTSYFDLFNSVQNFNIVRADLEFEKLTKKHIDGDRFMKDFGRVEFCPEALTVLV